MSTLLPCWSHEEATAKYEHQHISRTAFYDSGNHAAVLFQRYGSVWGKVFPFCIFNAILTGIIIYLLKVKDVDFTFSDKGHTFMTLMVSFLIVSRSSITYGRFMEARGHLATLCKACRMLVQNMAVLTQYENGEQAREWRYRVAMKTIFLLRVTCATLEYQSSKIHAWEVPELSKEHQHELRRRLILDDEDNHGCLRANRWAHGKRSMMDENFRVPMVAAHMLRSTIVSNRVSLGKPLQAPTELKLLGYVDDYMTAYSGLRKLVFAPFPFPLVQMARTFLFFWVFTLPFALVNDISKPVQVIAIIFIITYGFVGLEYVSIELDDPFGDDPNDFDDLKMAQMVFEDIYIAMNEADGRESADRLYEEVKPKNNGSFRQLFNKISESSLSFFAHEKTHLLNENGHGPTP